MNTTDAQKILALRKELLDFSYWYYVTSTQVVTDEVYDAKFRELLDLEKDHPEMSDPNSPTKRIGSPVPNGLRKVRHKVKMGSLKNIKNRAETQAFFIGHAEDTVVLEMKIDGVSCHLSYKDGKLVQAITRGDGLEGADVTENVRTIHTVPLQLRKPVSIEVRGEVYWRNSKFEAYNAPVPEANRLSNPRNGASGSLMLKSSQEVAARNLDFVAYSVPTDLPPVIDSQEGVLEYLEDLGFASTMTLPVCKDMAGLPYMVCLASMDELFQALETMNVYREALDLETDGVVVKLSSLAQQRDLGEGTTFPNWAAAYKFPAESKETRLNSIVLQIGKTGQITPVAQLEPVALGGTIVQRASICNQDELDRLGIDVGDFVMVERSGEVIPKITSLARPSPTKTDVNSSYQMPKTCPCCSSVLVRPPGMVHVYCPNIECYDQVFAKLVYAVGKDALDIDGIGETTVRTLMDKAGVKCLSDLFTLKDYSILKPAAAKKLKDGLEKAKSAPLWRKLSALSIEGIGKEGCQDLANKFSSISEIINDQEEAIEVIGAVAFGSFVDFMDSSLGLGDGGEIMKLVEAGFNFREDRKAAGPLSGKVFCITGGLMSGKRDDVSAWIQKSGGVVKGAVTKKVDFLIQGAGGGSNKAAGAAKHGTRVISEEELYRMIGVEMPLATRNLEP